MWSANVRCGTWKGIVVCLKLFVAYSLVFNGHYCKAQDTGGSAAVPTEEQLVANPPELLQHLFRRWDGYLEQVRKILGNVDVEYEVLSVEEADSNKTTRSGRARCLIRDSWTMGISYDENGAVLEVGGNNDRYAWEARRKTANEVFRIRSVTPRGSRGWDRPCGPAMFTFYQFLMFGGTLPWVLLKEDPGVMQAIQVHGARFVDHDGKRLIELKLSIRLNEDIAIADPHFRYTHRKTILSPIVVLVVDPKSHWLPVREEYVEKDYLMMGAICNCRATAHWEYELHGGVPLVSLYSQNGERLCNVEGSSTQKDRPAGRLVFHKEYRLRRKFEKPPAEVFYMSYYGIPEPQEVKHASRAWLWLIVAGLALVTVGLLVQRLRRKKRPIQKRT